MTTQLSQHRVAPTMFGRLSVMMLLAYMAYGSWWATLGLVLTSNGLNSIVGLTYSLAAVGAMASPLLAGAVADRFFASQRFLAALYAISGAILFAIPPLITDSNATLFLVVMFIYLLIFQPTNATQNNIVFANTPENSNSFPFVRAFGTAGWIIVGLFIGQNGLSASTSIFYIGGVLSLILAVYALTLPNTPPPARGTKFVWGDVVGAKAFVMFRQRSFTVLVICLLLAAVPISIYNSFGSTYLQLAGVPNVASFMTIGQATEIVALVLIPLILRRFRIKWVLTVGLLAWVVRAVALLAMTDGNIWLVVIIVALHGVCSDFVLLAAFMYADAASRSESRAQGQALIHFISFGVGNAVGSVVAGELFNTFVGSSTDLAAWNPLWYIVGGITAVAATIMIVFFNSSSHGRASVEDEESAARVVASETPA
ncbi:MULTISPECIES: MFS transporter [Nocardiaceae]|jgi:nucleoside transporter|uniref:MFS transporter n=1 Tax=Nocardiaceae TaxID=85025 RepID=UPI00056B17FB|nr:MULTISPECIES: MFS transporter [Rhodococcus]OZE95502.1 MFS transporter [Rhodococcus sp. 15-1189-1-1a]OZF10133.1 MFS transporter [Rhodococcus sp. 14-2686-1-2]OZF55529.1 MFS transporter [Rhodococcus sp. 14-2470-1b]